MTYKPVGVDENSNFPTRVVNKLKTLFPALDGNGKVADSTLPNRLQDTALNATYAPDNGGKPVGKGELYTNVRDYGAKGDGATDDTAAIQAAIDATPTNGTLFFPAGNFKCTSSLTVPSYLTMLGVGRASRVTYTGTGTFIDLVNKREVKWDHMYFVATGTSCVLFRLSNVFRCEWRECYLVGQFVGPANSGAYLNQIGIVFTANSGDNNFVNGDITNFGIGIKVDSIMNGVIGGKLGTNNVSIYGFGGGGMSITGYTDFVASPAAVDTHVIAAGSGQWWFSNVWMEGSQKSVQVGSNASGSIVAPSQFGMSNVKMAATVTVLDIQAARNPIFMNVQMSGDNAGAATPTPVVLDSTNAPEGVMFADSLVTGQVISPAAFPIGWMVHTRGGSTATFKAPNQLDLSYGASLRLARSDNVFTPVLTMTGGPAVLFRMPSSTGVSETLRVQDNAGAPIMYFDSVSSAVNYLAARPGASGASPEIAARGTDLNLDVKLTPKGTGKVVAGGPLQLKTSTTAGRPTAASAGVGGVIYDSSLSKPIYSDGATWRDATGVAV